MKRSLLEDLICPLTSDPLHLEPPAGNAEVDSGELICDGCGRRWPVRGRIPRLVPPDLLEQQHKGASPFGRQRQRVSEMHLQFEAQCFGWLHPIGPDFFRGKRVLDAGRETGRHAYFAASYRAAEVVALDLSEAVKTARCNLAHFDDVHVLQGNLLRLLLRTAQAGGGFDFVHSIGVLQHLPDPYAGFRSLLRYLRPGRTIAVWLYGYENNGLVRNIVEPLRRVSTKTPPPLLRLLAWPLAVGFNGVAKRVYRPLTGTSVARALPLHACLSSVADLSFRQSYGIVFDQLAAPTAAYIKGHAD